MLALVTGIFSDYNSRIVLVTSSRNKHERRALEESINFGTLLKRMNYFPSFQ